MVATAEAAGVDTDEFQSCLDSEKFQSEVQDDVSDARSAGGAGTPYNVIVSNSPLSEQAQNDITNQLVEMGMEAGSDRFEFSKDGRRLSMSGAIPFSALSQIIDTMLEDAGNADSTSKSDDIAIAEISEDDHIRGSQDASVAIVEYSDMDCPYCAQFHSTMKRVMDNYESNEVAWVYRHFPIPQLHPDAPRKARASECVADLGGDKAFWTFADEVFKSS